jgi:hypothetical protein
MIPQLTKAIPESNFSVKLAFEHKIWKSFSVIPYFNYPVFKPLLNELFFRNFKLKHNTLVWGQDEMIDFEPYTLWTESVIIEGD